MQTIYTIFVFIQKCQQKILEAFRKERQGGLYEFGFLRTNSGKIFPRNKTKYTSLYSVTPISNKRWIVQDRVRISNSAGSIRVKLAIS